MPSRTTNPKAGLPAAIAYKIGKTSQTRGADLDTIFQNRVNRTSTVLIPFKSWTRLRKDALGGRFGRGYIVLIRPNDYFDGSGPRPKKDIPSELQLGQNLLVFYETRVEWTTFPPDKLGWKPASSRQPPLGGQYVARVPNTTRAGDQIIRHGFINSATGGTGAGIRVFEYASDEDLSRCCMQLAYLAWRTTGVHALAKAEGVTKPEEYQAKLDAMCEKAGLADVARLEQLRVLRDGKAVCPLCLVPVRADELAGRVRQAEGREVVDPTITAANLFHVEELLTGAYNHRPYNLGWGHHHCNTTVRDVGLTKTVEWMVQVLQNNGYSVTGPVSPPRAIKRPEI